MKTFADHYVKSEKSSEKHYSQRNSNGRVISITGVNAQKITYTPYQLGKNRNAQNVANRQFYFELSI